jgi:hypothetical protein
LKKKNIRKVAVFVGACMLSMLYTTGFVPTAEAASIIYVDAPTGNYWEDHPNIQDALNAIAPGGTVVLAEGRYAIHKALVTHGFHGSVRGAGMDVTYIEAVGGDSGYFETTHMIEYNDWSGDGSEDHFTAMLYFGSPDTSLAVSDLTLEVNEPNVAEMSYTYFPATPEDPEFKDYWWNHGNNIIGAIDISVFEDCDTSFKNIHIEGLYTLIPVSEENPFGDLISSPRFGLVHWWSSGGSHIVQDCVFESCGIFQCGPFGLVDAEYIFEGNTVSHGWRGFQTAYGVDMDVHVRNNYFHDLEVNSVANYFLESSIMQVSHNAMVYVDGGFWVFNQWWVPEGSRYLIEHNYIELKPYCWTGGVEVWDFSDADSEFVVINNRIHSVDATAPYGPISLHSTSDSVIAFNKITGRGVAAMYIGAAWDPVDDVAIIGNNVQKFKVTDGFWDWPMYHPWAGDPIEGVGRIWLGDLSSNCFVVGGCNKKNVVNEGTDNIVVGVDSIGWRKLGQLVSAAMHQIRDMKRAFR